MKRLLPIWILGSLFGIGVVLYLLQTGLFAQTAGTVSITKPAAKARVNGTIQVVAAPSIADALNYAVLLVDGKARSATNALPTRFKLDTTKFNDGAHTLQVIAYLAAGGSIESPVVPITISNNMSSAVPSVDTPVPPPLTPAKPREKPVQAPKTEPTPVVAATPTSVPQPSVSLNGAQINFPLPPVMEENHIAVMLRPLVSAADGSIRWDVIRRQAVARVEDHNIIFTPGTKTIYVDERPIDLDLNVANRSNHIFVPVTAWRDAFNGGVSFVSPDWNVTLRSHADMARARLAN